MYFDIDSILTIQVDVFLFEKALVSIEIFVVGKVLAAGQEQSTDT